MLKFNLLFTGLVHIKAEIVAPLYWWEQIGAYPVRIYSSQDPITEKEFDWTGFSYERLINMGCSNGIEPFEHCKVFKLVIQSLNDARDQYQQFRSQGRSAQASAALSNIIQLLPSSYNRKKEVVFTNRVLSRVYQDHVEDELPEWQEFCRYIEVNLPYLCICYKNK